MPWLRGAVQERGPWKGWGHSQSHWDAALDRPLARVGFALQDTSLGEGIHPYKLAPSHPTPHPSRSWAAGWEQGELTWAPVSGTGHCWWNWSLSQPGWCSVAQCLWPRFGGFFHKRWLGDVQDRAKKDWWSAGELFAL